MFSGLSYAELSSIIPSDGGAYAYAYVALGELPAVLTAWCLTLEVSSLKSLEHDICMDYRLEKEIEGCD